MVVGAGGVSLVMVAGGVVFLVVGVMPIMPSGSELWTTGVVGSSVGLVLMVTIGVLVVLVLGVGAGAGVGTGVGVGVGVGAGVGAGVCVFFGVLVVPGTNPAVFVCVVFGDGDGDGEAGEATGTSDDAAVLAVTGVLGAGPPSGLGDVVVTGVAVAAAAVVVPCVPTLTPTDT